MPVRLNPGRSVLVSPGEVSEGATNTQAFPLRKGMKNLPEVPMQPVHIDHNPEVPRPAPAAADGASANPAPSTQPPAVNTGD